MEQLNEAMKKFHLVAKRLGQLQLDDESNPGKILKQMQDICDEDLVNHLFQFMEMSNEMNIFRPFENIDKISPKISIEETPMEIIIYCKVAGLDYPNVKVTVINKNQLAIHGKVNRISFTDDPVGTERSQGNFIRHIELPATVLCDLIKTSYHEEVLEIHLAKETYNNVKENK